MEQNDVELELHGKRYKISATSCHCGGGWAWYVQRPSGAWECKGCVCHNPALGV